MDIHIVPSPKAFVELQTTPLLRPCDAHEGTADPDPVLSPVQPSASPMPCCLRDWLPTAPRVSKMGQVFFPLLRPEHSIACVFSRLLTRGCDLELTCCF
jgi:hypothetical protein